MAYLTGIPFLLACASRALGNGAAALSCGHAWPCTITCHWYGIYMWLEFAVNKFWRLAATTTSQRCAGWPAGAGD